MPGGWTGGRPSAHGSDGRPSGGTSQAGATGTAGAKGATEMTGTTSGPDRPLRVHLHLRLRPQAALLADLVVVGAAAPITADGLQQALQILEPGGFEVETFPGHPTIAAGAVRTWAARVTWREDVVRAVVERLGEVADPTLIWTGSLEVAFEVETTLEI